MQKLIPLSFVSLQCYSGTQLSTKKVVAIKKIKIGQFKDGLDMSAIREVKTLQELRHPNVIEVSLSLFLGIRLLQSAYCESKALSKGKGWKIE